MKFLNTLKNFFTGLIQSIEYAQTKRAEAARRYWGQRWY